MGMEFSCWVVYLSLSLHLKGQNWKKNIFYYFFIIFHAKPADWHVKIHLGFVFYDFPTVDWEVTLKKKSTLTLILGLYTYQILDKS